MTAFDKIKNGLEEAVNYENGSLDAKSIVVRVKTNNLIPYLTFQHVLLPFLQKCNF